MVLGIQVIGVAFAALMLYLTFLFFKRGNYTTGAFRFWCVVWLGVALLILFPQPFAFLSERLQFFRTLDLYVAGAIMFFGAITFFNYASVKRQERKLEELVRQLAIRKKRK